MHAYQDLAYVAGARASQKLDLYLPDRGKKLPLVIWVHGGAFRAGSKKDSVPLSCLERGFAVASLNYRLSQEALFPAQIQDLCAAVRWLRLNAKRYRLDPDRFAAWGESAGGHLVAMLALAGGRGIFDVGDNLEVSSAIQAVVDCFGPTDFLKMDMQSLPGTAGHDAPDSPESELVGGAIQEHPELAARANPVSYVSKDAPPFLIVHGDRDPLVPYGQSLILRDALAAQGASASLYTVSGGSHGNFKDPKVAELIREFLERCLKVR